MDALAQYLDEKKLTQGAFASVLDVDRSTVSRWLNGSAPKRTTMVAIEKVTDGAVPVAAWFQEAAA